MISSAIYIAYDPKTNIEAQVTDFSAEALTQAAERGFVFYKYDSDGSCHTVPVDEVVPEQTIVETIELAEPAYVDVRMSAVVDVFNALEALMFPEASAIAAAENSISETADPIEVFKKKLTNLRLIASTKGE